MANSLTVFDQTTGGQGGGQRSEAIVLSFPSDRITVRELIRERVYQEVKDFNAGKARAPVFRGLVCPMTT